MGSAALSSFLQQSFTTVSFKYFRTLHFHRYEGSGRDITGCMPNAAFCYIFIYTWI